MEREVKVPKIRGTKVFQREWKEDGGGVNRKGTKIGGVWRRVAISFSLVVGRPPNIPQEHARATLRLFFLFQGRNIFHRGGGGWGWWNAEGFEQIEI